MTSVTEQQADVEQEAEVSIGDVTLESLQCSALDGRFSDVVVEFKDQRLQLHKVVLWSIPYFKPLLEGDWKDSNQDILTISVDDPLISGQVFGDVVRTAYDCPLQLTQANMKSILAGASFLQMNTLCKECVQFCIDSLSLENIFDVTIFALSNNYVGIDALVAACKAFLHVHAVDLKEQLWQLPANFLCELLESYRLWVTSEYERFRLIMDVFNAKIDICSTEQGSIDDGEGCCDSEACSCLEEDACGDVNESCSSMLRSESTESREGDVHRALDRLLSAAIQYGSLSTKESSLAFSKIDALKLPDAMKALANGTIKARILQSLVQNGKGTCDQASSSDGQGVDKDENLGWLRVGVQIDDAKETLKKKEWKSSPVFYGGLGWYLQVERSKTGDISAFVHCKNATKQDLYCDSQKAAKVEVVLVCKDIGLSFQKELKIGSGYGYRSFITKENVQRYIMHTGSLRISALVRRLFS